MAADQYHFNMFGEQSAVKTVWPTNIPVNLSLILTCDGHSSDLLL